MRITMAKANQLDICHTEQRPKEMRAVPRPQIQQRKSHPIRTFRITTEPTQEPGSTNKEVSLTSLGGTVRLEARPVMVSLRLSMAVAVAVSTERQRWCGGGGGPVRALVRRRRGSAAPGARSQLLTQPALVRPSQLAPGLALGPPGRRTSLPRVGRVPCRGPQSTDLISRLRLCTMGRLSRAESQSASPLRRSGCEEMHAAPTTARVVR